MGVCQPLQQETLLKHAFCQGDSTVEADWEMEEGAAVMCKVTNTSMHLKGANNLVLRGQLPGTCLGLFLTLTPLASSVPLVIPEDQLFCMYSHTTSTANVDDMASTDYLIEVTAAT